MRDSYHWISIRRAGPRFLGKREGELGKRDDELGKRDDEHGAGAIEFALILPFLLMIMVAIIEMSNVYFTRNLLSEVTRDATRRFAVGALEEAEVEAYVLKRLAENTKITGTVSVDETETDGVTDVSLSLSVPFAEVLLFDQLIEDLWSGAPENLSVSATMMKH